MSPQPTFRTGAPGRLAYSATIDDPGDAQAGPGYRTYRATVTVTQAAPAHDRTDRTHDRNGDPR